MDHFLRKWLQGANKTEDPITWRTLIAALRHANFQEEVKILEKHLIQFDRVAQSGESCVCSCSVCSLSIHVTISCIL